MDRREFLRDVTLSLPLVGVAACTEGASAPLVDLGAGTPLRQEWAAGWRFIRDREEAATDPSFDDEAWEVVTLPHTLVGANPFSSDGGIASILLQADAAPARAAVYALAFVREGGALRVVAGALGVAGAAEPFEVRVSTDGVPPLLGSPLYTQPVMAAALKAALFVGGQKLMDADSSLERFRLLGSRAPI